MTLYYIILAMSRTEIILQDARMEIIRHTHVTIAYNKPIQRVSGRYF